MRPALASSQQAIHANKAHKSGGKKTVARDQQIGVIPLLPMLLAEVSRGVCLMRRGHGKRCPLGSTRPAIACIKGWAGASTQQMLQPCLPTQQHAQMLCQRQRQQGTESRHQIIEHDALLNAARQHRPTLPARLDASSRLKVYVRDAADLPQVERALAERLGTEVPYMLVHAAICRRELAIEIDGVHGHTAQTP